MTNTTSNPGKRPPSGPVDAATSREKRLKTIACDRCRRRKVKCDGDGYNHLPCKYCTSVGLECTYGKNASRTNTNQSQIASSKTNVSSQPIRNPTRSKSTSATNGPQSTSRQRRGSQSNQSTRTAKKATSSTSTSFSIVTSSSNTNTNLNRIIPQVLPILDNDFEYLVKLFSSMSLQNEDQVRQQFSHYISQVQDEKETILRPHIHDIQKLDEFSHRFVNSYFDNFHPTFPVLHKAYFNERLRDTNKTMPRILLYAVCAIGSNYLDDSMARKDHNDSHILGLEYYEHAQGMYDSRSFKGCTYIGMATTFATAMRLQDKNASEGLSTNEKEARKRLWWSIMAVNNIQSVTLNRMSTISDKYCTIEFPEFESLFTLDEFESKIIKYFIQYFKITKIMYEILEINFSETNNNIERSEEKLNNWEKELPPYLRIENCEPLTLSTEITIEHLRVYLCILYNYAMIRIHYINITSDHSMATCAKAANTITTFINKNFLIMISSTPFIIHYALYAGFIHILNLKKPMCATVAKNNVIQTLKLFQDMLGMQSLQSIHSTIKNLIAIFTSQLECMGDIDDEILNVAKAALASISLSTRSPQYSPISPVTPWISHQSHQTNQQRQSVFATSPAPLSPIDPPPVNSNKHDSNSINSIGNSTLLMVDNYSSQYGHSQQHNQQQSSTQSRQHERNSTGSSTSSLTIGRNATSSLTMPASSSLPPLGTAITATNTTSPSSIPPSNNMSSNMSIGGNYVTGTEISGGLAGISPIAPIGGIGSENSAP
ncbi:32528_t:CDS:2, partial [Racocetra persica]